MKIKPTPHARNARPFMLIVSGKLMLILGGTQHLTAELATAAEADRTCLQHEAVRHQLLAALFRAGHKPQDSSIVDVVRPGERGPIICEVLPAGHTSYHAVRAGAVRVREIGQVTGGTPERLHVVLTSPPDEPWIPDLVEQVLDVSVVWPSATGWQGPGSSSATGTERLSN